MAMLEGALSKVANFKIANMPLGAVLIGGAVAGVGAGISEVISAFVPGIPTGIMKGLAAWGTIQFGGKLIGREAAELGGMFLLFDAITDFIDIKGIVRNFVAGAAGKLAGGLGGGGAAAALAGAAETADYYGGLG